MRKKPLAIGCGILLLIVAAAVGFLGRAMFGEHTAYATEASSHKLAPPSAKEINYYERRNISGIVSVTYLVREEEFRQFAKEQGWTLEQRMEGPGDVTASSPEAWANGSMNGPHPPIGECLFYEVRQRNGGGITVIYDLAA